MLDSGLAALSQILFIIIMDRISTGSQGTEEVYFVDHRIFPPLFADDFVLLALSNQDVGWDSTPPSLRPWFSVEKGWLQPPIETNMPSIVLLLYYFVVNQRHITDVMDTNRCHWCCILVDALRCNRCVPSTAGGRCINTVETCQRPEEVCASVTISFPKFSHFKRCMKASDAFILKASPHFQVFTCSTDLCNWRAHQKVWHKYWHLH